MECIAGAVLFSLLFVMCINRSLHYGGLVCKDERDGCSKWHREGEKKSGKIAGSSQKHRGSDTEELERRKENET